MHRALRRGSLFACAAVEILKVGLGHDTPPNWPLILKRLDHVFSDIS
jgi:hypothetical protein